MNKEQIIERLKEMNSIKEMIECYQFDKRCANDTRSSWNRLIGAVQMYLEITQLNDEDLTAFTIVNELLG